MTRADIPESFPTKYWHVIEDGRVQCDLCPRYCRLREGQRGLCFVRACEGGEIVLTTYGRSSGFCIDPIEKKPLNHFYPGTPVLSFGTAGCNLACKFCQNWDISKSREMDTLAASAMPEAIARAAVETGCQSVAFTYNDPVIFHEYAIDVAVACHEAGVKTVAVTAGVICDEPRREFFRHIDAANVDLKGFTEGFYRKLCKGDLATVLDTLVYLQPRDGRVVRDHDAAHPRRERLRRRDRRTDAVGVEHLGPDVPLHFSAFHPDFQMRDKPSTPAATLTRARDIAMNNGMRYVYTGNVHDEAGGSTYCHECGVKLIGRDWYMMTAWNVSAQGTCGKCGAGIAGRLEATPGGWGAKRVAIDMRSFA